MKRILILLASLLVVGNVYSLPPCSPDFSRNCFGTQTFSDGSEYVGEFKDRKFHGQGTFAWTNGAIYGGEWLNGKMHGQGTITQPNGGKYVGEWKDGKYYGQGSFTWPDGAKYVGEWRDGNKHGQGTHTWTSGSVYIGEWRDGNKHGQGTQTTPDGAKYVGEWEDGEKHGWGEETLSNSSEYVGQWKGGKFHGQGTYTGVTGSVYIGGWKEGKKHGQGSFTWPDGAKYVGEWKDGDRHGQGTETEPDGAKYVGEWRNDYQWQGTTYNSSKEITRMISDGLPAPACASYTARRWSSGTGFAVSRYHVVTSAHVLFCCKEVIVRDLESCRRNTATIVATEQESDLGLLRLDEPVKRHAMLRRGKELQLGETLLAYDRRSEADSCPQYTVRQGSVTKLNWMAGDSRLMRHDLPTRSGASGGPVLDASGHIVGVSTIGNTSGTSSEAVKSFLVEAFLKTNRVEYSLAPSIEKLGRSEIKERSDKFTLIVECL